MAAWPYADQVVALLQSAGIALAPEADVDSVLAATVGDITRRTGLSFTPVTESRDYPSDGLETLYIAPCQDITAVSLLWTDGTVIYDVPAVEFVARPLNLATKTSLRRTALAGGIRWPVGPRAVRVTATYGAPVPDDLVLAATYQSAGMLLLAAAAASHGAMKSWTILDATVTVDPGFPANVAAGWRAEADRLIAARTRIAF